MAKTVKLSSALMLSVEHEDLTMGRMFERVLMNFTSMPAPTSVFILLETLILTSILIESIIKNGLKEINPVLILDSIDPINVALISGKKKELISRTAIETSDIKSAPITVLLDRFAKFYNVEKYLTRLRSYFNLRNKIVHSAECVVLEENKIAILLTKNIFPFIKEYVDVKDHLWQEVEKIAFVAHSTYEANLVRVVLKHRKRAEKLPAKKLEELKTTAHPIERNEVKLGGSLVCPACHNNTMDFIAGVEAEYEGPDEYSTNTYEYAFCRVCELVLEKDEIQGIMTKPECYFSPTKEDLEDWNVVIGQNFNDVYRENNYTKEIKFEE